MGVQTHQVVPREGQAGGRSVTMRYSFETIVLQSKKGYREECYRDKDTGGRSVPERYVLEGGVLPKDTV